jgi:NitT/TauT family transport system substrate-binding protein
MDRRSFAFGAASVLGLAAAGCNPQEGGGGTTRTINVAQWGQEKYLIYLPFYLAQETGAFSRRNIEVNVSFSGNDDQVFASVLRGDAQFGIGDPIFAAISRDRGGDGVVVGQVVGRVALWGVSKNINRQLAQPSDFARLRIGTFPRPSTAYTLTRNMVDQQRIAGASVAEVPIGSEAALLESSAADIVMMLEPAASSAEASGYHIVTSFARLWGPFAFTGLTSTQSYTSQNAEVVADVQASMQEALEFAHTNADETKAIAGRLFPSLDAAVVGRAVDRMLGDETLPRTFAMPDDAWAAAVNVRKQMSELTGQGDYLEALLR